MNLCIESEVSELQGVVLHAPGEEIESVSPSRAAEALYNDVLPMAGVRQEHERLAGFLRQVTTVYEFRDLLVEAASVVEGRREIVRGLSSEDHGGKGALRLRDLDADALVDAAITGVPARVTSLPDYLHGDLFAVPPVPNLYFMRDVGVVIGDTFVPGRMAHSVRRREARLAEIAFRHAQSLSGSRILWPAAPDLETLSGPSNRGDRLVGGASTAGSLEGGDVLVFNASTIIVGISERTTADAVDHLATALAKRSDREVVVYAALLPKTRATIHLDMVFTLLNDCMALVHAPLMLGPDAVPAVRSRYHPRQSPRFDRHNNLLQALSAGGIDLEPVICGGSDPLRQEREQWLSGTNVFAFAPGKVIAYDCNAATLDAFNAAGFAVRHIDRFLSGDESADHHPRLVVAMSGSDLARGGGGPRCMTLPIRRGSVRKVTS